MAWKNAFRFFLAVGVLLAGRVPSVAQTITPRFAYVTNLRDNNVSQYTIGPDGRLAPISPPTVGAGPLPTSVTVDPFSRFAYVSNANSSDCFFLCFHQGHPGRQESLGPGGCGPGSVSAYAIDPASGALTQIPGSPFTTRNAVGAAWVTVDPSGIHLYTANEKSDNISAFRIDQKTGALMDDVPGSPFAAGKEPNALAIDPSGRYLYVTNECSGDVVGYTINENGALSRIPGFFRQRGSEPSSAFIDSTGQYLYVGTGDDNNVVWAFKLNPDGTLSDVAGTPFPSGRSPEALAVDPFSRFLYSGSENDANVTEFSIDVGTGTLTRIRPPVQAGLAPSFATVELSGNYLYVTNEGSNDVWAYSIDQNNGTLSRIQTILAGALPSSIVTVSQSDGKKPKP